MPFDAGGSATVNATWIGIDAALAARAAAPEAEMVPAAIVAGRFNLEGVLSDTSTWLGIVRLRSRAGRNARGRIAVGGDVGLDLRDGRWTVRRGGPRRRRRARAASSPRDR